MMTEFEFENGKYGLRAVVKSAWSYEIDQEIRIRQCVELEINHAKGWVGADLDFLSNFPWLKALKIIDFNIKSVEPIHVLHELRALEVMTYCRTELRFSAFPQLEDCALEWHPKAESLFDCIGLKSLFVNNFNGKTLIPLSRLENLESLAVLNAPIESLDGIASLIKLRSLRLANLKKLQSLAGIENLTKLEELEVHTCKKIASIKEIAALFNLRRLHLNNDGDIASLKPLNAIEHLESVIFYESTNIVDGDLSPLIRQANLSHVSFKNRRHYSHKREEFGATYSK
jgi:hypothetical protein